MEKAIYGTWAAIVGVLIKVFIWDSGKRDALKDSIEIKAKENAENIITLKSEIYSELSKNYTRTDTCLLIQKLQQERHDHLMKELSEIKELIKNH